MHKHTNISVLLTILLGGWWFGVEGRAVRVEAQRTFHRAVSFTKTFSCKLKQSLSFMAEQSKLLDLSKEFMASTGMISEG